MSDSTLSSLPRFDNSVGLSPLAIFDERSGALETVDVGIEASPVEVVSPDVSVEVPSIDEEACFREEAQRMLEGLSSAIGEIERSASQKIALAVRTVVGEIFPHLSSTFSAEEFALHVPELVKLAPPIAEIQATPRVAEHLKLVSRNMDNWPTGWAIETVGDLEETRVQVVWEQGGLTYDPDKVLTAWLSRLGEHLIDRVEE